VAKAFVPAARAHIEEPGRLLPPAEAPDRDDGLLHRTLSAQQRNRAADMDRCRSGTRVRPPGGCESLRLERPYPRRDHRPKRQGPTCKREQNPDLTAAINLHPRSPVAVGTRRGGSTDIRARQQEVGRILLADELSSTTRRIRCRTLASRR